MITLRPYQEQFVDDIRSASAPAGAVLCVLPTGGGKTVIFCHIAERAAQRGKRSLIVVHRKELIDQTSATLTAHGIHHGIMAAGYNPNLNELVQVGMVQSLLRREFQADIVIIDECHHAAAQSYQTVMDRCPSALKMGFTATPERLDGKGLGRFFSKLVEGPSVSTLQDGGYLCRTKYFTPPQVVDLSGVRTQMGDYQISQLEAAANKSTVTGDAVAHYKKLASGCSAVVFCVSVAHAQSVADSFNEAGVAAGVIHGGQTKDERTAVVDALRTGRILILVSVMVIAEGFDLCSVGAAILLRPTKSLSMHLQQIGRVLRPAEGKPHAIILDHVGNLTRNGLAEDVREWCLTDRVIKPSVAVSTCQKCFATFSPRSSCPECGHVKPVAVVKPIETVEGELVEFGRVPLPFESQQVLIAQSKRTSNLKTLMWIANQLGFKPGWAWHTAQLNKSRGVPAYG